MSKFKEEDFVIETHYAHQGKIVEAFEDWEDLKAKSDFLTIDPDGESDEMDKAEKLINGDPKDKWLEVQEVPFTKSQLNEPWYSIECFGGGAILSCESRIEHIPWTFKESNYESN